MARRFNRYARGLLSLLNAQVEGRAPSEFSETLQPTLELTRLLAYADCEQLQSAGNVVTSQGFLSSGLTGAAADEIILVLDFGVVASAPLATAGDQAKIAPAIERRPGTSATAQPIGPLQSFVQNDFFQVWATGGPWLMFPNEQLGLFSTRIIVGGAAVSMQSTAKIARLRV
jgi:hypothetical protein